MTTALSLPEALQNPGIYDHPVSTFKLVETHISWVILTGPYAYKIKKPVNLGFLDFSTLEKRRHYCEEEVRINHRLCPGLYEGVIALTGDPTRPVLNGQGPPFEFMVKMKQFDEELLWDRMLERNELNAESLDKLAPLVAEFHQKAPRASIEEEFGLPDTFWRSVEQTLRHIESYLHEAHERALYQRVLQWLETEFEERSHRMIERLREGFVREGHGDMHLRNIALFSRACPDILIFDGIEFDPALRWIDVINDVAFLTMDLEHRGRPDLAWRFLNAYLEMTGDYEGLDLLRLYAANRALVRAKVLALQSHTFSSESRQFLQTANTYAQSSKPCLYITHGLSGSGKTTYTKPWAADIEAVRIRSDIERKRLFGLAPEASSSEELKQVMYGPEGNRRTYEQLKNLASRLLTARYPLVIDAAFLRREPRQCFRELAAQCGADFRILDFRADEETLRRRIGLRIQESKDARHTAGRASAGRVADASEADLKVLEDQIRNHEDITEDEKPFVLTGTESAKWVL